MQLVKRLSILFAMLLPAVSLTPAVAQTGDANTIKQIDTECSAIQNAVMALTPTRVLLQSGKWVVVADATAAAAVETNQKLTFADVYKQGNNYAWVHAHSVNQQGTQRATQLCFRQSDGTLQRVRQATTIPGLSEASAEQAYYSTDGKVIQKTKLFEVNDPMIAKTIKQLPFYAALPQ
jgi:ligand-binding SRPBCC domain-containing protein